ncbi:MAG: NADAR family protein [Lentisphaerae bacterium]|nr:NADAR family protein [Lentisphaerota bacterium]
MIFSYHNLLYLQLSAQTIEKGCCSPFLRFCNSPNDWDMVKLEVMEELLRIKFSDEGLKQQLISTGEEELIEGNYWHNNFRGCCSCEKCGNRGMDNLGKLLMKLRSEYRDTEKI